MLRFWKILQNLENILHVFSLTDWLKIILYKMWIDFIYHFILIFHLFGILSHLNDLMLWNFKMEVIPFSEIILCFFREKLDTSKNKTNLKTSNVNCLEVLSKPFPRFGVWNAKEMIAFYYASLGMVGTFFDTVDRISESLRFACFKKYLFLSLPAAPVK